METKTLDIIEAFDGPYFTEAQLDPDNLTIVGVCPFGTDKSQNNRIYKNKAIESLTRLVEGAKMYLNHPSKTEIKEREGVRDVRDWAGVFTIPRRNGNKVFANLKVREEYWDLLKDVAELKPEGMGLSINARVKVYADEKGMESVEDVDSLRSVDLVASAATTKNLFESYMEKIEEDKTRLVVVPGSIEKVIELMFVTEGVIQDKLDNDKIKREIDNVTWTANDMIDKILYDEKLSVADKKKKVLAIFGDLESEVKKRVASINENLKQVEETEIMSLTLNQLKEERKDLVEAIIDEYKEGEEVKKMKGELEDAQESLKAKDDEIKKAEDDKQELKDKIKGLEKELSEVKTELDEKKVQEKAAEKRAKMDELIAEMKLPKEAVSEVFMANLMGIEEYEKDEKTVTVEEQARTMIKDRQEAWDHGSGKVRNSGEEHVDDNEEDKEVTDKDVEEFAKKLKKGPGEKGWSAH